MILTQKYKFKKRELTDSPPDITATEDNWDKAEAELDSQAKQITDLSPLLDRGYLTTKEITSGTNIFNIWQNGKYQIDTAITLNVPLVNGVAYLDVSGTSSIYFTQRLKYISGQTYEMEMTNGSPSKWKQIATTEKIDTLFTPYTGYKISVNKNCKINNILYINFEVSKVDGTSFAPNSDVIVATSPIVLGADLPLSCTHVNTGVGYIVSSSICFCSGSNILIKTTSADVKKIVVSGVIVL